ncbi:MAG: DUF1275 domain-containing protein [Burkholderiaceae bacterium]|nr:DUF1275 domain-containing protein [Burkholderiaceae bacterium]
MPIAYLSRLTARFRTRETNLHIGVVLTVVAGALNAGGFLAIGQYTSHMTGMVSTFADQIVLRNFALAAVALASWLAFVAGAAATAILVNYQRRYGVTNIYAAPLLIEAMLILVFGSFGGTLERHELGDVSLAVITLCLTMGLQNALITKISRAEIRTTHVTGLTTDLGIELGKLLYWNRKRAKGDKESADTRIPVTANRRKLRVHAILIASFVCGGVAGALGFKHLGFVSAVPLALALTMIALAPAFHKDGD